VQLLREHAGEVSYESRAAAKLAHGIGANVIERVGVEGVRRGGGVRDGRACAGSAGRRENDARRGPRGAK